MIDRRRMPASLVIVSPLQYIAGARVKAFWGLS